MYFKSLHDSCSVFSEKRYLSWILDIWCEKGKGQQPKASVTAIPSFLGRCYLQFSFVAVSEKMSLSSEDEDRSKAHDMMTSISPKVLSEPQKTTKNRRSKLKKKSQLRSIVHAKVILYLTLEYV